MSVSGARKSKELTEKYTAMVYGSVEQNKTVKSTRSISFCPKCKSYIPPHSKCGNCGYEPENNHEKKIAKSEIARKSHAIRKAD